MGSAEAPTLPDRQPVSTVRVFPAKVKVGHRRFVPSGRPTVRQAWRIATVEARRWHVSPAHLNARIECESGHHWNATNGQFRGLGQFAYSTFQRGVRSIGTRRVMSLRSRTRWLHTRLVTRWYDGARTVRLGYRVKVKRTMVRRGLLPKSPDWVHGWVQIRLMARAIAGLGAVNDSEWSCR